MNPDTGLPVADEEDSVRKMKELDDTIATYAAAIRACGAGRSGPKAVLGALERMRWAKVVEADERTYAAAIRALRVCGDDVDDGDGDGYERGDGVEGVGSTEGGSNDVVPLASEVARDLISWDAGRGGRGVSPFLYR